MGTARWTPWALLAATNAAWAAFAFSRGAEAPERREVVLREVGEPAPALRTGERPMAPDPSLPRGLASAPAGDPPAKSRSAPPGPDPVGPAAWKRAEEWAASILQIQDVRRREDALSAIQDALAHDDVVTRLAGLLALRRAASADFPKGPFRASIVRLLNAARADERRAAFDALLVIQPARGDVDRVLARMDDSDPDVRRSLARWLVGFGQGEVGPREETALLRLTVDPDERVAKDSLEALGHVTLTPALEARVLSIGAGDDRAAEEVSRWVLHRMLAKSDAVISFLVEKAERGDARVAQAALDALGTGLSPEKAKRVVSVAIRLVEIRAEPSLRQPLFHLIGQHATPEAIPDLQRLADRPRLDEYARTAARELTERLRRRRVVLPPPR